MIAVFESNAANDAWIQAYDMLLAEANTVPAGRLGETKEILHANFHITDPRQRWILSRMPALNPAFAIAEVFWILAGDNNASFLNYWNPILPRFSGAGKTYHGAYGYRLRNQFGFDQLERAYNILKNNPSSRQVVLQIWDPAADMPTNGGVPASTDVPCNICAIPKVRNGKLEWLQIMRSNDVFLGVPHNFIQFSTLQEIMAGWLDLELGSYHHISDSLHLYERDVAALGADRTLELPVNTDSLAINIVEFKSQLDIIVVAINNLSSKKLSKNIFLHTIHNNKIVQSYKNLLLIVAADSARRRGWKNEMEESVSLCSNLLLQIAFRRWESRYPVEN